MTVSVTHVAVTVIVGMAEMANELYEHLEPHIKRAKSAGQAVCFGGHSLGGALATLVCSLALLKSQLPSHQLQCVTFGSPSVLAHTDGKDGNAILQVGSAHADSSNNNVVVARINSIHFSTGVRCVKPVHAGQLLRSCMQTSLKPKTALPMQMQMQVHRRMHTYSAWCIALSMLCSLHR